jgi:hypothetical protein
MVVTAIVIAATVLWIIILYYATACPKHRLTNAQAWDVYNAMRGDKAAQSRVDVHLVDVLTPPEDQTFPAWLYYNRHCIELDNTAPRR